MLNSDLIFEDISCGQGHVTGCDVVPIHLRYFRYWAII